MKHDLKSPFTLTPCSYPFPFPLTPYPPDSHRRVHEQVGKSESLEVFFFPDKRGKHNAVYVYPRKPSLPPEVGTGRFAAVQQPKNSPRNCPENLNNGGGGGVKGCKGALTIMGE